MAVDFGILHPLWNYADDQGALLERVTGEIGIDHLTVPAITGACTQFRTHAELETPLFHTAGGWHFPTASQVYSAAGVRPQRARWFGAADILARLAERTRRHGLRLVLRIDLRAVHALVEHEPHLCQRNAWGQPVPTAGACACSPDLRELLRATLDDLRRYEPRGFQLVNWQPDYPADGTAAARPLDWQPRARALLDKCFCASCRQIAQRAGLDVDELATRVQTEIHRLMSAPEPDTKLDSQLARYDEARHGDCAAWLRQLAGADKSCAYQLVHGAAVSPSQFAGDPLDSVVELPAYSTTTDAREWLLQQPGLEHPAETGLRLATWRPFFEDSGALGRVVLAATRLGIPFFDFAGLDQAPAEAVTWLRQAVRNARRD